MWVLAGVAALFVLLFAAAVFSWRRDRRGAAALEH
jgi:hypothetical protein